MAMAYSLRAASPGLGQEKLGTPILFRGVTNEVRVDVPAAEKGERLWLSVPSWSPLGYGAETNLAAAGQPLRFQVMIAADAPLGFGLGRIFWGGNHPPSAWLSFYVDDMDAGRFVNGLTQKPPQSLASQGSYLGRFVENEILGFEVEVPGGRVWTAEVVARRMGAPGDPVLWLEDMEGKLMASSYAIPGLSVDARIDVTLSNPTKCRLRLHESRYRGGATFPYYLRMGSLPRPVVDPVAVRVKGEGVEWVDQEHRGSGDDGSVVVRRRVSTLGESWEKEPNEGRETATGVGMPGAVLGGLRGAGDQDWFRFEGRKGQKISMRALARALHAGCDVWVGVTDSKGARLASASLSDRDEPALTFEVREDGPLWIQVREAAGRGGEQHWYRLEMGEASELRLRASTEAVCVDWTNGWTAELTVKLDRAGWEKPVRLEWVEPVPEVALENAVIEAGKREGILKLRWVGGLGGETGVFQGGMKMKKVGLVAVAEGVGRVGVKTGYRSGVGLGVHLHPIPAGWEGFLWVSRPEAGEKPE